MSRRSLPPPILFIILISFVIISLPAGAATFTVTNLNDSGTGSLRQAILDANNQPGPDTIQFQAALTGTITLSSVITITDSITINGLGVSQLAISGNNASQIFDTTSAMSGRVLNIKNLTLRNAKGAAGGAISDSWNSLMTLNNCVLLSNSAASGGGIYKGGGTLTVNNSTLSGNSSTDGLSAGGGIANFGSVVTINNTTLSYNSAVNLGGGIANSYRSGGGEPSELIVNNSTLSGNSANLGGGIGSYGSGKPTKVNNSTLSGNSATTGGGIYFYGGDQNANAYIANSIVAGNISLNGKEIYRDTTRPAQVISLGHNLFGENGANGLINVAPLATDRTPLNTIYNHINLLDNYGGPTQTHLPTANSWAINNGDDTLIPAGVTTDQRGYGPRIVGAAVDIGAVEVGAVAAYPVTVNKTGGNGTVTSAPAGINCGATCTKPFAFGSTVTLTATPAAGYGFTGWLGACTGTTCKLTMTAAKSVTALFNNAAATYTLTVAKSGNGAGTVTSNPAGIACGADCTQSYNQGTSVTLAATPAAGSKFAGWSGACAGTGACAVSMTAAKAVTATFTRPVLTVGKVGSGLVATAGNSSGIFCGTDCAETYNLNAAVNLVAIPGVGRRFVGWTGCTGNASFPQLCTVTMSQSKSVVATFQ